MTPCLGIWVGYVQRVASRPQISVRYARYVTRRASAIDAVYEHCICSLSSELTIRCILEKNSTRGCNSTRFQSEVGSPDYDSLPRSVTC